MVTNTDVAAFLPLLISLTALDTPMVARLAPATVDTVLVPLEEPDVLTTTVLTAAATRATALVADMVATLPPPVPTVPAATLPPAVLTVPAATLPHPAAMDTKAVQATVPPAVPTVQTATALPAVATTTTDGEHSWVC